MKTKPWTQEYWLKLRLVPFSTTRKGPISDAAPYPIDEHPGPARSLIYSIKMSKKN